MKKQLLNAAGFGKSGDTSVAMADISILGMIDSVAVTRKFTSGATFEATYADRAGNAGTDTTISTTIVGDKVVATSTETKASGSMGGVSALS